MSKVLARRGLPRGRVSRAFHTEELKDFDKIEKDTIYLDLDVQGFLVTNTCKGSLLNPVAFAKCHLAGDVQNKNLEMHYEGDMLTVRLLKDVAPDDVLELWFSETVLAKIDMPFLTPRNIRGRKNYVCHECGALFEQPNPLKLHLFLSCQELTPSKFWKKFVTKIKEENLPLNLTIDTFSKEIAFERPKSQENVERSDSKNISRCFSEPPYSAFKPYNIDAITWYNSFNNNSHIIPRLFPSDLSYHPAYTIQKDYSPQALRNWKLQNINSMSKSLERVSVTSPAEIEAFATNWGKSKEGHLCLYCGKVYSRKYGLKIHIRTHTGYKPLQCKYCFRPFGDPSNLNKHVRLHAQSETPYSCNLCGKMLVRKRDLERHLRSRHSKEEVHGMTSLRDSPSP